MKMIAEWNETPGKNHEPWKYFKRTHKVEVIIFSPGTFKSSRLIKLENLKLCFQYLIKIAKKFIKGKFMAALYPEDF